jgi:HEAT repeat protein
VPSSKRINDFTPEINNEIASIYRLFLANNSTSNAEAIERCCNLGWQEARAVEQFLDSLLSLLETCSQESEEGLCYALYHCAPSSIEPLIELLSNDHSGVKIRAAKTLAIIGKGAQSAEGALTNLLDDTELDVAQAACRALGLIFASSELSINRIVQLCRAENSNMRSTAVHALAVIVSNTKQFRVGSVLELTLIAAASDVETETRRSAYYGIRSVAFLANEKRKWLITQLNAEPDASVQAAIIETIIRDTDESDYREVVPFLIDKLGSGNRELVRVSCELINRIGTHALAALPTLQAMLDSDEALTIAETIWGISHRPEIILPVLIQNFDDDGERICDLCCEMGSAAAPLLPKLLEALANGDSWDLQWAAADAIGMVCVANAAVIPDLLAAMNHKSPTVLGVVARSLAAVGPAALEPLMALAQSDHTIKRNYAIYALGKMGREAKKATDILRMHLSQSTDAALLRVTSIALAHVAGDPATVPILIQDLTSEADDVPAADLIDALGAVGPLAADAIDLLQWLTKELAGSEIGEAAQRALLAIES